MYTVVSRCAAWVGVLLASSVGTACGQQSTLSNIGFNPCCIAADGHGNNFVVGSGSQPTIAVAKVDSSGQRDIDFLFPRSARRHACRRGGEPSR